MPAHRSPGTPPSRACLPALVPSCQEKGQATGRGFLKETPMPETVQRPRHILTFDLEENFHASRFDSPMRRQHWSSFQSRIQTNLDRILESPAHHSTKATFFVLGWLAERHPSIIHSVLASGHEIACLGYGHELVAAQPRMRDTLMSEFRHYVNLDKTAGRLHRLLADFQFGPLCEVALPIHEQIQNAAAQTVPDSTIDGCVNESPYPTPV